MKARGILYSAEMIRAKLEGRKTMTRRIIKDHINIRVTEILPTTHWPKQGDWCGRFQTSFNPDLYEITNILKCPFGKVGDLLYAKETFTIDSRGENDQGYYYKADFKDTDTWKGFWKPSIFMPKSAARIIDMITGIKAERLQDISPEDVVKEGIKIHIPVPGDGEPMPKLQFKNLWISINGEESWNTNPWVWVIETKNITTKGWSDIPQTS